MPAWFYVAAAVTITCVDFLKWENIKQKKSYFSKNVNVECLLSPSTLNQLSSLFIEVTEYRHFGAIFNF